jgi:serine/threonine protein phosphatase PrpC
VVSFCAETTIRCYKSRKSEIRVHPTQANPSAFLTQTAEQCDFELKRPSSNIDVEQSGSTAVLVLLMNECLTCASVGDSRAILASTNSSQDSPAPPACTGGEERRALTIVKSLRSSHLAVPIFPIQLTRDQKPDDPEESERIYRFGGTVSQLIDPYGNKVGPHRVWKKNVGYPGLAMSRSIGDTVGAEIGVIATPVTTRYALHKGQDLFIVAASDGVWDVMDNEDVVNFVECYRGGCRKGEGRNGRGDVGPGTSSIARLLCEEARVRWLSIVEDEDVLIDDISCVVIELEPPLELQSSVDSLKVHTDPSKVVSTDLPYASSQHKPDPRRGSMVDLTGNLPFKR